MKISIVTNSEAETVSAGRALGRRLVAGAVVALYGGLGAGKTAFVRGLAEGLGLTARVTSPTFTVVNEYFGQIPLFHFDMYRLTRETELYDLGWDDYLERDGVIAVEWSENVSGAIPAGAVTVSIARTGDLSRVIEIS
jgi:tRNA threonylcarbamoyladenosine biosynthesis protein TsaE